MKKALTTITLAMVMAFGSTLTFASGGIMVSDGIVVIDNRDNCTDRDGIVVIDSTGIVVIDAIGIMVSDLIGSDDTCGTDAQNNGIMVSD